MKMSIAGNELSVDEEIKYLGFTGDQQVEGFPYIRPWIWVSSQRFDLGRCQVCGRVDDASGDLERVDFEGQVELFGTLAWQVHGQVNVSN